MSMKICAINLGNFATADGKSRKKNQLASRLLKHCDESSTVIAFTNTSMLTCHFFRVFVKIKVSE